MSYYIRCPKCNSIYTKSVLDTNFNLMFQCTECGHIWYPSSTHLNNEDECDSFDLNIYPTTPIYTSDDLSENTISIEESVKTFVIECKELQFNINDVQLKTDSNFFEKFDTLVINGITYKKVK